MSSELFSDKLASVEEVARMLLGLLADCALWTNDKSIESAATSEEEPTTEDSSRQCKCFSCNSLLNVDTAEREWALRCFLLHRE